MNKIGIISLILIAALIIPAAEAKTISNPGIISNSSLEISSGDTLLINESETLIIEPGTTLTVKSRGKMEIASGSVVEIKGILTNFGKIKNRGTINNHGTIVNYCIQLKPGVISNYGIINNYNIIKNYSVINGDINTPPLAVINGSYELAVNNTIYFSGKNSSDIDGSVADYQWDFGDGKNTTNSIGTCSHYYDKTGTYTVSLTVTDNMGAVDTDTLSLKVTDGMERTNKLLSTLMESSNITETAAQTMETVDSSLEIYSLNYPPVIVPVSSMLLLCTVFRRRRK